MDVSDHPAFSALDAENNKTIDAIDFDLGNLLATDFSQIDMSQLSDSISKEDKEAYLLASAKATTQKLISRIFDLPSEKIDTGALAQLPQPRLVIPRGKPIPMGKPLTRWEKFAQEKGIVKRKRSRMVYDEDKEDWIPRYGAYSAPKVDDDWVVEQNGYVDPKKSDWELGRRKKKLKTDHVADPFEERENKKRESSEKLKKRQLRNMAEAAGMGRSLPGNLTISNLYADAARKQRDKGGNAAKARTLGLPKSEIEKTIALSQKSTASLGKFDKILSDEPNRNAGKRRAFDPVEDVRSEKEKSLRVLSRLVSSTTKELNTEKAVKAFSGTFRDAARKKKKEEKEAKVKRRSKAGRGKKKVSKEA